MKLGNALLLCRGKLIIGSDSVINGAVMVQQDAILDGNSTVTGDREVLEPFYSIISY